MESDQSAQRLPMEIWSMIVFMLGLEWTDERKHHRRPTAWRLYATSKSFQWLTELEFLCVEHGEVGFIVQAVNVVGQRHGPCYHFLTDTILEGFAYYVRDRAVGCSTYISWPFSNVTYLYVNGKAFHTPNDCTGINVGQEASACSCHWCVQMVAITSWLARKDPVAFRLAHDYCEESYGTRMIYARPSVGPFAIYLNDFGLRPVLHLRRHHYSE